MIEGLDIHVDTEAWEVLRGILASWDEAFSPSQQSSSLDVDLDSISVASSVREGVKDRHLRAEKALGVTKNQSSEVVVVGVFSLPTIVMSLSPAAGKSISMSLKGLSSAVRFDGTWATVEGAMGGVKVSWTDDGTKYTLVESGGGITDKLVSIKVVRNERLDETDIIARFESMQVNYNAERVKEILGCLAKLKGGERQEISSPPSPLASWRQSPTRRSGMMASVSSIPVVGTGIVGGIGIVSNSDNSKANKTVFRIKAELKTLTLHLNSVLDDELLFGMTMSSLSADMSKEGDEELAAIMSLGDFQIFTDAQNERVNEGKNERNSTKHSHDLL